MFTKEKNRPLRSWDYQLPVVEEAGEFIHSSKFHRSASCKLYPYDYVMKTEAYAEYHVWSQFKKGWTWTERQIFVIWRYPCPHDDWALRVQRLKNGIFMSSWRIREIGLWNTEGSADLKPRNHWPELDF